MNGRTSRRLLRFGLLLALLGGMLLPISVAGASTPAWQPVGDTISGFSMDVIHADADASHLHLTNDLHAQAHQTSIFTMLGLSTTPSRYWYWIKSSNTSSASATLTFYSASRKTQAANQLALTKTTAGWRIGTIVRTVSPTPTPAPTPITPAWQPIGNDISGFSMDIIHANADASHLHLTDSLHARAHQSSIWSMLGLSTVPSGYWYWIKSYNASSASAKLTFYLPSGKNPVTNQLQVAKTSVGWRISQVAH